MQINIFETPIEYLKGVGPKKAEIFKKEFQIFTFQELLYYYPYRHVDKSQIHTVRSIEAEGAFMQFKGKVIVVDFGIVPGYPGATTTLTNWSIYYDESMIAGWEWYLDNESSPFATTKDASYIFTETGHTVTLKVQGINGCWAEVTKEIPLLECPVPTIEVDTEVETCGLETVTIEGSFEDADEISIKTLNSPGRKARLTVHNDGTFTVTYNPTIANVGKVVEIVLTATDSSLPCAVATKSVFITVKPKPRIRTKGVCVE